MGDAHAPSAAAGRRLHDHRVADLVGDLGRFILVLDARLRLPGKIGVFARLAILRQLILSPSTPHGLGAGADELDVAVAADLGEVGVLREEPVAGVDRVDVR